MYSVMYVCNETSHILSQGGCDEEEEEEVDHMLPTSKPCLKKPRPTVPGPRKPDAPQEEGHHEGIHLFLFLLFFYVNSSIFHVSNHVSLLKLMIGTIQQLAPRWKICSCII